MASDIGGRKRNKSRIPSDTPALDPRLAEALRRTEADPGDTSRWNDLEEISGELQLPESVAALFLTVLEGPRGAELADDLGQRAVRFHEEWFGDDPASLIELLHVLLKLDPSLDWAFERLTLLLSVGQRWPELLELYDETLARLKDGQQRRKILQEAAGVAKDFLGEMDRAIGYLDELFRSRPSDPHIASALERLLEKEEKWGDLARVWQTRLDYLSGNDAHELRGRLATLRLDRLADPTGSLADARTLLGEKGDDGPACQVLERILAMSTAPANVRRDALELVRAQHEKQGRKDRIVAILQTAHAFASDEEKVDLLRESAERLQGQGEGSAAMEKLVELLAINPDDTEMRTRLRHLAELSGAHDMYVKGLAVAAEKTPSAKLRGALLMEAGRVLEDVLANHTEAIVLFSRAADDSEADTTRQLTALRRLISLLDRDDQAAARLNALLRVASLATENAERRTALGQAGRLAGRLGEIDRAVVAWQARLALDATDREALTALVDLLAEAGRHEPLCTVLRQRADNALSEQDRRADLARVARLQASALSNRSAAIETWLEVQHGFGEDAESTQALRDLFGGESRWQELSDLLARTGKRDRTQLAELYCRLGELYREHLDRPIDAVRAYGHALETDPAQAQARAGLMALLDVADCQSPAIAALVRSYSVTREISPLVALVERRLLLCVDDAARARLLVETAELVERDGGDREGALKYLAMALGFSPENARTEGELLRLAPLTDGWVIAVEAIRSAIAKLSANAPRVIHLRLQEATILEEHCNDRPAALAAFEIACQLAPDRVIARSGRIRVATALGNWAIAAEAMLAAPVSAEVVVGEHLPIIEKAATALLPEAWKLAGAAIEAEIDRRKTLPRALCRDLEGTVASWYETYLGDTGKPDAAKALARAVKFDRHHTATLTRLCDLQRAKPDRALFDTLNRLVELQPTNLDLSLEALDIAHQSLGDRALTLKTGLALIEHAAHMLRAELAASGKTTPAAAAERAVEIVVQLLLASGDKADGARAVSILQSAATLSLPLESARAMRRRAAKLALDTLADRARARDLYRLVADDEPSDRAVIGILARLYEEADLLSEVLSLRKRELGLDLQLTERLHLRLEMARIAGLIEGRSPRVTTLLANLTDLPGDRATIEALSIILTGRGAERDLVEVLTEQSNLLERSAQTERAAELWSDVARLCERSLSDMGRALAAYEHVVNLQPTDDALDALARISKERGDALAAAGWLEQRLQTAAGSDRVAISLRLGQAYLESGQRHRAISCLERALAEDAMASEIRTMLIEIYRKADAWEPLARTLAGGCQPGVPAEAVTAFAREAATIYQDRLATPEFAVPVLETAVALVPKDRWLRTHLAEGLRVAGRLHEARAQLESLLEEMGRRRSKERAAIHHQLALVARAEKNHTNALEHLDQAAAIDMSSMAILLTLGETAEEAEELERAERAYQALLVLARRVEPTEAESCVSETLLRLEKVARAAGNQDSATEFYDSATATAMQNADEARRMQNALHQRGDSELALQLLDKRRAVASAGIDQARILCERAEMLEKLDRLTDALAAVAQAIERAPELAGAHEAGRRIAHALQKPAEYLAIVEAALDQMRRRDDGTRVCDLLLRAGNSAESDLADPKRAAGFYARAEQTGTRALDVMVAIGRISGQLNDTQELARVLKQLGRMSEKAETPDEQVEIAFRQAELQLSGDETRTQGLETLAAALEKKGDFARALQIVRAAKVPEADLPRVMPLYERVARSSGDDRMLLDFLERRAAAPDATQEAVSEGVEVALATGESARAEKLLERAVELSRAKGSLRDAAWALLDLAQRCKTAGDLEGAFRWLEEAGTASDSPRISALLRELARQAAREPDGSELAAKALERLRERNPGERELWQPLMELYAAMGDGTRLGALVDETVQKLVARNDRIFVRMTWAHFLLKQPDQLDDGVSVLRDILLEEPGHAEALSLLAELHEARGEISEALALLSDSLREAESKGDEARRAACIRRLGDLLGKADPDQAKQVYRQTLASSVSDASLRRDLQERLFALLGPDEGEEKATLGERMLADETGTPAESRALTLADVRHEMGDEDGELRVVKMGLERAPKSRALFERLATFFSERQQWNDWVGLMGSEVERLSVSQPSAAAELLDRVATIRREKLKDPSGAVDALRSALTIDPANQARLNDLVTCLQEMGDLSGAIEVVSGALGSDTVDDDQRLRLLRLRAALNAKRGETWQVVGDLEMAMLAGGMTVAEELTDALFAAAQTSARSDDLEGQRRAMLRLVELFSLRGDSERAQRILFDWVDDHPEDTSALRALRERFEKDGQWEDVARVCQRIANTETGEGKIEALLGLSHALQQVGRALDAVAPLEELLANNPGHPAVVNVLGDLYQQAGDTLKIAHLKIDQAALMHSEDDQFHALVEGADMLLQGGEPQQAVEAINRAFALRPEDRTVQRLLSDALLANGQFDQAAVVLEQLIGDGRGIEPEELCALYHRLSRASGGMGDGQEQLNALKKAMETDRKNGYVAAELADLAEALGDDDLALKALRAITLNAPDGPMTKAVAFYRQARIAHKGGDRQRALIFAKRALQEDPNLAQANELLESVR